MPPEKAPGPDGFSADFILCNWNLLKCNVLDAVKHFFRTGRILREVNHTFLTLVPKCSNACSLTDVRPIACCNLIYKLISKVLSNRLKVVTGELISQNQSAFLQGIVLYLCRNWSGI